MLILIFKSKQLKFAINAENIKEIIRMVKISTFPVEKGKIFGVINYRAKTIPILDIRKYLNLEPEKYTKDNIIIVSDNEDDTIGVLADDVSDSIFIGYPDLQVYNGLNSEYFKSFIQYKTEIVPVLNMEKLISDIRGDVEELRLSV